MTTGKTIALTRWTFVGKVMSLLFNMPSRLVIGTYKNVHSDSILKSRDIASSTKVHLVKAMVFPVVMYGCENWTIRKLSTKELMFLNCGVGEDS